MFREGQHPDPSRYAVIPRTLTFLTRPDDVLMIRIAQGKGAWAGRLNGIGGHIEAGEDPQHAARREVEEESGLTPGRMRLVGVVLIDVGQTPGIGLYVFVGEGDGDPRSSREGEALWVPLNSLDQHAVIDDIPQILPLALRCYLERMCFTGVYSFGDDGRPIIQFHPLEP